MSDKLWPDCCSQSLGQLESLQINSLLEVTTQLAEESHYIKGEVSGSLLLLQIETKYNGSKPRKHSGKSNSPISLSLVKLYFFPLVCRLIFKELNLVFSVFNSIHLWNSYQRATPQRVSANISVAFNKKSLITSSVIAALLFSSSVTGKPGSPATWCRAGLQCNEDEGASGGLDA